LPPTCSPFLRRVPPPSDRWFTTLHTPIRENFSPPTLLLIYCLHWKTKSVIVNRGIDSNANGHWANLKCGPRTSSRLRCS